MNRVDSSGFAGNSDYEIRGFNQGMIIGTTIYVPTHGKVKVVIESMGDMGYEIRIG